MVLPDPGHDVVREAASMAIVEKSEEIGHVGLVGGGKAMVLQVG